jgi:hypothetical protein
MAKRFGFDQLPVALLIPRDGRIANSQHRMIGMIDEDAFEKESQILRYFRRKLGQTR